jgi:hypothetical protein
MQRLCRLTLSVIPRLATNTSEIGAADPLVTEDGTVAALLASIDSSIHDVDKKDLDSYEDTDQKEWIPMYKGTGTNREILVFT